uniref:Uncharacterized protein n=1 Tax=Anguilla anguilla TaxID=7936 RepID=A0A0E9PNL5_ANGAN
MHLVHGNTLIVILSILTSQVPQNYHHKLFINYLYRSL